MIDLRSDTLTVPNAEMMSYAMRAEVGDAGRINADGRSCDPSVNRLEDLACSLTGKEAALFMPSGTLGNLTALLTYCSPGDKVLIDHLQHSYRIEKAAYAPQIGGLEPRFFDLTDAGIPDIHSMEKWLESGGIKLLCIENTHNGACGAFIPESVLKKIHETAIRHGVPVHMDGARLFNASVASGTSAKEICQYVDSVMFCVSKGLGGPMGSLLCGDKAFIERALETRKILGGNLRQVGYMAAAGEYALLHNIPNLKEDHRRAALLLQLLQQLPEIRVPKHIDSNIIIIDVSQTGLSAEAFIKELYKKGVWLSVSGSNVRALLYTGVSDSDVHEAARIIGDFIKNK